MSFGRLSKEELEKRLAVLLAAPAGELDEREHLLYELQLHQLELEVQNRELIEARSALELSRNSYADLYDLAPVPYFTFDRYGVVLNVNLAGALLVGLDRALVIGAPFLALVRSEDESVFRCHLQRSLSGERQVPSEFGFTTDRTGLVHVQMSSAPVLDAAGTRVGVRVAFSDVTARKRIEADRRASFKTEQRLREVFEGLNRAGVVVAEALTLLGDKGPQALLQVIVDQARVLVRADFGAISVGGLANGTRSDGWVVSGVSGQPAGGAGARARTNPLFSAEALKASSAPPSDTLAGVPGAPPSETGFLAVPIRFGTTVLGQMYLSNAIDRRGFSDIDARGLERLAEHVGVILELARLHAIESRDRERLAMLARASDLLASTLDLDAVHGELARIAVPWLSDFCCVMLPRDARLHCVTAAHDGTALKFELAPLEPEPAHAVVKSLATAWYTQRPVLHSQISAEQVAAKLWSKLCPGRVPSSVLVVPMLSLGVTTGLVCFVQTSAKRVMEERDIPIAEELAVRCCLAVENARLFRARQDAVIARDQQLVTATDALAARDGVLRIVAHDLRSPLAGIRLLGSSLLRQVPEAQRTQQHPMALLGRTVARMDRLIQDLLDVARLDGGALPLEPGLLDVSAVVSEALDGNALRASQSGIRMTLDVQCSYARLYADRARLLQALDNLVGNALKFTPSDGLIQVGALDGAGTSPEVVFFVRDNGAGIAPEHRSRLFERFWKAAPNDARGAGLGLSIVKGIVDAHGGRVWVESALGEGSTFYFAIPVLAEALAAPPSVQPSGLTPRACARF